MTEHTVTKTIEGTTTYEVRLISGGMIDEEPIGRDASRVTIECSCGKTLADDEAAADHLYEVEG